MALRDKKHLICTNVNNKIDRIDKETDYSPPFWDLGAVVVPGIDPRIDTYMYGLCRDGPVMRDFKRILMDPLKTNISSTNLYNREDEILKAKILVNRIRLLVDCGTTNLLPIDKKVTDIIDAIIDMQWYNGNVILELPMVILSVCGYPGCDNNAMHNKYDNSRFNKNRPLFKPWCKEHKSIMENENKEAKPEVNELSWDFE